MPENLLPAFSNLDISSTFDHGSFYEYAPLPSERSIRIIELLPETPTGMPRCKLNTTNLDDENLNFTALSYTWEKSVPGQQEKEHDINNPVSRKYQILCEGHAIDVTENLYDFLKRAAPGQPDSWLKSEDRIWIDAICINQSDLNERSAQVRLMSELYRIAKAVYVWLGEGEDQELQIAVHLMKCICARSDEERRLLKHIPIKDPRMKKMLGEYGGSWDHWRALKSLCSRPWFGRVWIIQEVAFALNVRVFCGRHCISWDECVSTCWFLDYSMPSMQMRGEFSAPIENATVLKSFTAPHAKDIWYVLNSTRKFDSSDPRDKIFAILGLAFLGHNMVPASEFIHVDYEIEPSTVYMNAVRAIMVHAQDLSCLTLVEDRWFRKIKTMPTWIPDFSSTRALDIYQQGPVYNAGRGLDFRLQFTTMNPHLLQIRAYRLGKITETSSLRAVEEFLVNCNKVLDLLFQLPPTYVSGQDRLEVLWRTLIQNGFNWVSPAPDETSASFRNWLLFNIAKSCAHYAEKLFMNPLIDDVLTKCDTYSKSDPTGLMPSRHEIEAATRQFLDLFDGNHDTPFLQGLQSASRFRHEFRYYQLMYLFVTDGGLLGLGSWSLEPGDSVWIVPGSWLPMIFRNTDIENHFEVMGPAYVHGIMHGEALDWGNLECRSIVLQ